LHPKVANDPRVEVRDEVNARDIGDMVRDGRMSGGFDVVVADLSFISLTTVAKSLMDAARAGGTLLLLVKPQFEATKEEVDRGSGVIADDAVRQRCIRVVRDSLERLGARYVADVECAVPGPAGNREHWLQAAAQ
jgi:23S rRNA (cytidine1920-2'-O)/16S rRNA (cytidine1409-2'-O)-methyltransferase